MNLQNMKVLVIGTGISGIGAARLLYLAGAKPILYDGNEKLTKEDILNKLPSGMTADIIIGSLPLEILDKVKFAVPSPGVSLDTPLMEMLKERNVPIYGEIELGYAMAKGQLIAITGTNGKTTTTSLVGEIMKDYYHSTYVVGNIGNPYTEIALDTNDNTVTVAEVSSFQLETIHNFKPQVSAILNITPDHLDRHHSMEGYVAAKERIAENQTKEDVCVLNYENEYTRMFGERCLAKVVYFSSERELKNGFYLSGEDIYMSDELGREKLMNIHDMNLVGICNVENVMAALAISLNMGVPLTNILGTIRQFKAVEHRIEYVATKRGVDYYNDSKGTNPDAAIQGIRAMSKPTVLIGGGYDKQSEYDEWIESFDGKVKCFILIGQTADKIEACARKHGLTNILRAETFNEALALSTANSASGDAVLLSPACASWGMFPNYEVRGEMFKDYVNSMED